MNIAVVGTGYVGLVAGTCFAETGNTSSASTSTRPRSRRLQQGKIPIYEPGLEELVKRNAAEERLSFTTDAADGRPRAAGRVHRGRHAAGRGRRADLQYVLGVAARRSPAR